MFQGIYPQIYSQKDGTFTYLHQLDPEITIDIVNSIVMENNHVS